MLDKFDNTWGIVKESGESSVSFLSYFFGFIMYLTLCSLLFLAQVRPEITQEGLGDPLGATKVEGLGHS